MDHYLRQLARAFECLGDAVTIADPDDRLIFVNPACEKLYGHSREELIGQPASIIAPSENFEVTMEMVQTAPDERWEGDVVRVRQTGEAFPVHLTVTLLRERHGRPIGTLAVERDVSASRQLEEHLFHAQKMEAMGQLAVGIVHHVDNLLSAFSSYVVSEPEAFSTERRIPDYLRQVQESIRRASSLTRQMLALSPHRVTEPGAINLNNLIIESEKALSLIAGEDARMAMRLSPDLWTVRAFPRQINQLLDNLVANARDAMPEGGELTIETANVTLDSDLATGYQGPASEDYVMLSVSHTGAGMTEEARARAFEPFFSAIGPGVGNAPGLSACYDIVTQHGGHITVDSQPGQGATFKVFLRRAEHKKTNRLPPNAFDDHALMGLEAVLLVESAPLVRSLTATALRERGYRVLEAVTGSEALRVILERASGGIHLLMTDVAAPIIDGKALADRLKELHPEARVLYTLGYADYDVASREGLHPDDEFIRKPFTSAVLARRVREILGGEHTFDATNQLRQ